MHVAARWFCRRPEFRVFGALTLVTFVAACGGDSAEPDPPRATTLTVSPSSVSFETAGATAQLSAQVSDQNGAAMPLATVTWSSSNSGVATVDAAGTVTSVAPGTAQIRATSGSASGEASATVTIVPVELEVVGGDTQVGAAGEALESTLQVRALDATGNPAPGAEVDFEVVAGEGSLSPTQAQTSTDGIASATWTLGTVAGVANAARAALTNGQGQPVEFSAESVPGAADSLRVEAGADQSGLRNRPLATELELQVVDAFSNAIPGASFDVSVTSGEGTVTESSGQADSEGRFSFGWTLGTALGTQTLQVQSGDAVTTIEAFATAVPTGMQGSRGNGQTSTVGAPTPVAPAVLVTDEDDLPVPGVDVTFTVIAGAGSLAAPEASGAAAGSGPARANGDELVVRTDAEGIASVVWTLGTAAGRDNQVIEAAVPNLEPTTFTASASAGPAAALSIASGDGQSGGVGLELEDALSVLVADEFGNPVEGFQVGFAVASGDGSLSSAAVTSDEDGLASTRWTLGPQEGEQGVTASAEGLESVAFTATATLIPASMTATQGDGQTATVATAVSTAPAVEVLTATNIPVPGAVVTFAVTDGGGSVTAGGSTGTSVQVAADASGIAALDAWTLGTVAGSGAHELTASVSGVDDVVFTASATPGPVDSWSKALGDNQTGTIETALSSDLFVEVVDEYGNGVSGVDVTFATSDGSASPGSDVTGSNGRASTTWTLGATEGAQTLTASAMGLPVLTFSATGEAPAAGDCVFQPVTSGFDVQLCFLTEISAEIQAVFEGAQTRWQSIITGDLSNVSSSYDAGDCAEHPALSGVIDDVLIFVEVKPIDGVSGILGSAGPCYIRGSNGLPTSGSMTFDVADLQNMLDGGTLEDVILHEMGHVLGIGTLWDYLGFLQNPTDGVADPTLDTHFNGPLAIAAFDALGGSTRTVDSKVPVENAQGGGGTLDGHWRESTMNTELMTGFIDSGPSNPLSAITIQSLADIGYTVDVGEADSYTVFAPNGAPAFDPESLILLKDDILRRPLRWVDDQGRVIRITAPR